MRKILLLAAIAVTIQFSAAGQEKPKSSYIGIAAGISNPAGVFGGTDVNNPRHGFAKSGKFAEINFGYRVSKRVGITGILRRQEAASSLPLTNMKWETSMLMPGIFGHLPVIPDKIILEPRALIGPVVVKNTLIEKKAYCFGYSLGISAAWHVSRRTRLSVTAEILSANPVFTEFGIRQKYVTINTGLGLAYRFS